MDLKDFFEKCGLSVYNCAMHDVQYQLYHKSKLTIGIHDVTRYGTLAAKVMLYIRANCDSLCKMYAEPSWGVSLHALNIYDKRCPSATTKFYQKKLRSKLLNLRL
jgi:hypothetical protein